MKFDKDVRLGEVTIKKDDEVRIFEEGRIIEHKGKTYIFDSQASYNGVAAADIISVISTTAESSTEPKELQFFIYNYLNDKYKSSGSFQDKLALEQFLRGNLDANNNREIDFGNLEQIPLNLTADDFDGIIGPITKKYMDEIHTIDEDSIAQRDQFLDNYSGIERLPVTLDNAADTTTASRGVTTTEGNSDVPVWTPTKKTRATQEVQLAIFQDLVVQYEAATTATTPNKEELLGKINEFLQKNSRIKTPL
jgi:hypothetical protein